MLRLVYQLEGPTVIEREVEAGSRSEALSKARRTRTTTAMPWTPKTAHVYQTALRTPFNRLSSCGFSRYRTRIHARYVRQKAA